MCMCTKVLMIVCISARKGLHHKGRCRLLSSNNKRTSDHTRGSVNSTQTSRVGQNLLYAPYMTVYLVISQPKIPYIHHTVYIGFWPTLQTRQQGPAKHSKGDRPVTSSFDGDKHISILWGQTATR